MIVLLWLLACGDDTGSGESGDSSVTAGVPPRLTSVTWDGGDGLIATWEPSAGQAVANLIATDADGNAQWRVGDETGAHVTGLADGVYRLLVEGADDDQGLDQLVGENRLVPLGQLPHRGLQDLWGEGDVVVAAGGMSPDADLVVVDATDPLAPVVVSELTGVSELRDVHLEDGVLYGASDRHDGDPVGVWILDLSDPAAPAELARVEGDVHNLHYGDGHLYLADMIAQAVTVLDVRDPTAPTWVAEWPVNLGVHDVTWVDGLLYVASPGGLHVLDVADPAQPVALLEHELSLGNPADGYHNVWPSEDGTHLFTTHEAIGGRLKAWRWPYGVLEEVSAWPAEEPNCAHNVHVRGQHAFASWYLEGVRVLDVSDPASPQLIGWHDTFVEDAQQSGELPDIRGAWGVWPYGDHVVVSDTETGLWWFDFYPVTVTAD